ncbi:hypothetical protein SpAn4DRAFT_2445 [Sporomusa ovata]|uniref:Uncharacterized protein n=1 Tax=Sporomusa ovata TaxID=2378 RepID=A0A0U1L219_9FIRM|nr:hypothetical protein SpAn4DRAFT_2445 [Sporomusa ovata]
MRHWVKPPFRGCLDTHRNSVSDRGVCGAIGIWSGQYFAPLFQAAVRHAHTWQ